MTAGLLYRAPADEARKALVLGSLAVRARQTRGLGAPWSPYPHQTPPIGDWYLWMLIAGRGSGKTEAGAHATDAHAMGPACLSGPVPHRISVVSTTHDDAVDTCVRGESGLLSANPRIRFTPGAQLTASLTWANGAEAELFGTFGPEDVERFRGPQFCYGWYDEMASWRKLDDVWPMMEFGLRLGPHPRAVITTTPKPRKLLKELMARPGTVVGRASTDDNPSLDPAVRAKLYAQYGGTTLGRQELEAELIEDMPGALWRREMIEVTRRQAAPPLTRIVVAIDPSATSTESSDEAGIIVAGIAGDQGYVLADYSLRAAPNDWANIAIVARRQWAGDRIIAETNNGGEMVEAILRTLDVNVPYKSVTASRGKVTRAEPISALYEQGRIHHVGTFEALEDQMCSWVPGEKSPDRMDALVWAFTELMLATDNPWAGLAGKTASAVA